MSLSKAERIEASRVRRLADIERIRLRAINYARLDEVQIRLEILADTLAAREKGDYRVSLSGWQLLGKDLGMWPDKLSIEAVKSWPQPIYLDKLREALGVAAAATAMPTLEEMRATAAAHLTADPAAVLAAHAEEDARAAAPVFGDCACGHSYGLHALTRPGQPIVCARCDCGIGLPAGAVGQIRPAEAHAPAEFGLDERTPDPLAGWTLNTPPVAAPPELHAESKPAPDEATLGVNHGQ